MREIEFRGKRIDNGEWIYGCCGYGFTQTVEYIMPDMFFATRDFGEIDKQGNPKIENEIAIGGYFAVDPKSVGQFSGLLDKNGKKIFEGDIVKWGDSYYLIEYKDCCFWIVSNLEKIPLGFTPHQLRDEFESMEYESENRNHIEVVGNVFENKDIYELTKNHNYSGY